MVSDGATTMSNEDREILGDAECGICKTQESVVLRRGVVDPNEKQRAMDQTGDWSEH